MLVSLYAAALTAAVWILRQVSGVGALLHGRLADLEETGCGCLLLGYRLVLTNTHMLVVACRFDALYTPCQFPASAA